MSETVEVQPGVFVPVKCRQEDNLASVPDSVCTKPGSLPRCQLCPESPNYWRKAGR